MSLSLFKRLDGLVELLVLETSPLFFKRLHLLLLLEQSGLDLGHVLVRLEHLCEKVVGTGNGDLRLDEDLHAFLYVFSRQVIEGDLSLNVIMDCQLLRHNQLMLVGDGHVL